MSASGVRQLITVCASVAALLLAGCGGHAAPVTTVRAPSAVIATTAPTAPTATAVPRRSTPTSAPRPAPAAATRSASTATSTSPATATSAPPEPTATATPDACPGAISWAEAAAHVGRIATIRGPVVGVTFASDSRGQPTFLDIGKGYPDPGRFTVVIWIPNRDNFSAAPEELYRGRTVCVTGEVTVYDGVPEMEIIGPEDIVVS